MKTIDGVEKLLGEWTLIDILGFCKNLFLETAGECESKCPLYEKICSKRFAHDWDIEDLPSFSNDEIENAKHIMDIFGYGVLYKNEYGVYFTSGKSIIDVKPNVFPSIDKLKLNGVRTKVKLSDIIPGLEPDNEQEDMLKYLTKD